MRIVFAVLLVVTGQVTESYKTFASCINGAVYDAVNQKCYIIRHKLVTRNEAERNCENMEAVLAIAENSNQQSELNKITENYKYWVGANDKENSREYKNPDGTNVTFFYWDEGQPNDDVSANDQTCVHMTERKWWHDDECYNEERYVCQIYKPVPIIQVRFQRGGPTVHDVESYRMYTTGKRLHCQISCLQYPVCTAYVWNTVKEVDNCQLLTPLLGNTVTITHLDNQVYEAVER